MVATRQGHPATCTTTCLCTQPLGLLIRASSERGGPGDAFREGWQAWLGALVSIQNTPTLELASLGEKLSAPPWRGAAPR